jgi:hypothetical protein
MCPTDFSLSPIENEYSRDVGYRSFICGLNGLRFRFLTNTEIERRTSLGERRETDIPLLALL